MVGPDVTGGGRGSFLRHGSCHSSPVTRTRPALVVATACAFALALTALTGGRLTAGEGYADAASRVLSSEWWTLWALAPLELALVGLLGAWMILRIRAGDAVRSGLRYVYAASALLILVLAVSSPIGALAQGGLLSAHMMQHVLIGAAAPLLVLLALPPRPRSGAPGAVERLLRRVTHPIPAFLIWAASTVVWLLPDLHHEVVDHVSLWVLQQVAFFGFGLLLWAPILERLREVPAWFKTAAKCGYLYGVFAVGLLLANIMWFSGTAFYDSHAAGAEAWGISPLNDQANAGTVMMVMHCLLAFGAIAVLFFRRASADVGREGDFGLDYTATSAERPASR
jgi:putative membrane protein